MKNLLSLFLLILFRKVPKIVNKHISTAKFILPFTVFILFQLFSNNLLLAQDNGTTQEVKYPTQEEINYKLQLTDSLRNLSAGHLEDILIELKSTITGPEQDCGGAIQICDISYSQPNSYDGYGSYQEVDDNNTCLHVGESNSVWYVFTAQNDGTFFFMINTPNDYDFALYDITTIGCAGVSSATPLRCNYSADYGSTGIVSSASGTTYLSESASGPKTMPGINALAGKTYALIVDNYTGNENGYTITFSGTASIFDNTAPTILSATDGCESNYVTLELSELILCSSIDISDFSITDPSNNPVTITSVVGNGCSAYNSLVNTVNIYYSGVSVSGLYTLTVNTGSDGNTLLDKCGNELTAGASTTFEHLEDISISATQTDVCAGVSTTLTADAGFSSPPGAASYSWIPSGASTYQITVSPTNTINYVVNVTYGSCTLSASQTITVGSAPVVSVTPVNPTICSGTVNLTATVTINGIACSNCNYSWNSGAYTETGVASSTWVNCAAGTYTVSSSSGPGCPSSNIATTTVNDGSSSTASSECNVYYVKPVGGCNSGAGCGEDPSNPSTLTYALSQTACSDFIIKMQTGTYNISDYIGINSYITLEGGYNSTFATKTSNMASGSATTIVRDATIDSDGSALGVTAIRVSAGAGYFRLQDLRIQMPTTHTQGSRKTNYGIYLESACHDYDIVRCYIDAGKGAAGFDGDDGTTTGTNGTDGEDGISSWGGDGGGNGGDGGDGNTIGISPLDCGDDGSAGSGGAGGTAGCSYSDGEDGVAGAAGVAGVTGADGSATSFASNYFVPGSNGLSGTSGTSGTGGGGGGGGGYDNDDGGGGGGGGGSGSGGDGGDGGAAGGGSFGVFSVNKGSNTNVIDCYISAIAGAGGAGGTGKNGGSGGSGGDGGWCDIFDGTEGGNGGAGGAGGKGGDGGSGAAGIAYDVSNLVGTTCSNTAHTDKALISQTLITVDNVSCTGSNVEHISATSATWTFNGSGSDGTNSGSGTSRITTYPTTGRKTISFNGHTYTDFNFMIPAPSAGTIISASTAICSDIDTYFQSSHAGESGYSYVWTVNAGGNSYIIDASTEEGTDISFTNNTGSTYSATITLTITSGCCGAALAPINTTIDVYSVPDIPTASADDYTVCTGGSVTLEATAPIGANFAWYTVASGGSAFATGLSTTISNLTVGTYTYYVEAISSNGCISSRLDMTDVIVTDVSIPNVTSVLSCTPGNQTMYVDAVTDAISYNWYSSSCGGTLEQSGTSLSYTTSIISPETETYYVAVEVNGCDESACSTVTAEYLNSAVNATWTGAIDNNWFDVNNWAGAACLPTCATNVDIPNTANSPNIPQNIEPARCKNITIQNGSTLSFGLKGELEVCGNFIHNGYLDMDLDGTDVGTVIITGGIAQSYTVSGGTGYFNNLTIAESSTFNLSANIDVNANINILPLSAISASLYTINIAGNWINSGNFIYGTSTVIFDGTSQQKVNTGINKDEGFFNVTIDGTDVIFYYDESGLRRIDVHNNLIINSGKNLSTIKQ